MNCKRLTIYTLLNAVILALTGFIWIAIFFKNLNNSCKASSPGEHLINVPGQLPFHVLCSDNITVGLGWTIIQQRINGKENFQRDWKSYRDGFGSFDGDFFLGLNKIHHITHSQRHELYIYMQEFNNKWYFAHYNNFTVGSEDDLFELQSLGNYTGTYDKEHDYFSYLEHVKFTTYDRDNDEWKDSNCADKLSGGWWYKECASSACNLNGKYFPTAIYSNKSAHFLAYESLQKIQMLIRPIN